MLAWRSVLARVLGIFFGGRRVAGFRCLAGRFQPGALRSDLRESRGMADHSAGTHRGQPGDGVDGRLAGHRDEGGIGRVGKALDRSETPVPADRAAATEYLAGVVTRFRAAAS